MIAIGDQIPNVTLKTPTADGIKDISTHDLFRGKKAVLFAVPGAFTPTCSDDHLPSYTALADDLKAKGIELVVCTAVNDAHVLRSWSKARNADGLVQMLADGNGDFARAVGLEVDLAKAGMGLRSRRYAMVLDDGVVRYLVVEPAPGVTVSGAAAVVAAL